MRINSLVLLLFFLFGTFASAAQDKYLFELEKFPFFTGKDFCKSIRVIDARKNKDEIGRTKKGIKTIPIVTNKLFDSFLTQFYTDMNVNTRKVEEELVIVLYDVAIMDKIAGHEMGRINFSADFFRGKGQYQLLGTLDHFEDVNAPYDFQYKLTKRAQAIMHYYLEYYGHKLPEANDKVYTLEEVINKRSNDKKTYPIYTTAHKTGIYYTLDQFLNNTPVDTPFMPGINGFTENNTQFYYKNAKGKRGERIADLSFFAIYNGKDWWVRDRLAQRKMRYIDGDFYSTKLFRREFKVGNDDVVMAGVMFGLVGALVASATQNKDTPHSYLYKTRFNPSTKEFVVMEFIK